MRTGLPRRRQSSGFLSDTSLRYRPPRSGLGEFAVPKRSAGGAVADDAVPSAAFLRLDVPARGGLCDQHLSRLRAGSAQIVLRRADRDARGRHHVAPWAAAREILGGSKEVRTHARPVAIEFFGHQHRQRGRDALAHLRSRDADVHGVVRLDRDPGRDLARLLSIERASVSGWERAGGNPRTRPPAARLAPNTKARRVSDRAKPCGRIALIAASPATACRKQPA